VPRGNRGALSRWTLRIAAALTIAPLYFARHLPFCDLPEHVAVIATLRNWWDPAWKGQQYFSLDGMARTQYVLYDVVGAILAVPFGSAERANLFMLSIVGLAFPYALRELLLALRRDERLAIFACPMFWSRALAEGLINYVASIPVAILGLALVARQAEKPTRRRAIGLAGLSLALFYLHLSSFVLFLAGAGTLTWLLPMPKSSARRAAINELLARLSGLPRRLLWLAPVGLACVIGLFTSTMTHPDASQGAHAGLVRFAPKLRLLAELAPWMHDVWRSHGDDLAAGALWLAFAAMLLRRRDGSDPRSRNERSESWMRLVGCTLFAIGLAFFFFMPAQVSFAFLLDVRMAPFVGLLAPLILPLRDDTRTNVALGVMTAAAFFIGLHGAWQMHAYEREEAAHFDDLLRNLPRGKKLLTLIFDQHSERAIVTPFVHFGAYYRARYGGVASFSFSELPHWPVQYRPEMAPPKKTIVFWDWNPCLFRNSHDGPYYDFVLTRGETNPFASSPPGPVWRAIGGSREWRLWARVDGAWNNDPRKDEGPCSRIIAEGRTLSD
jgi:hypothetical protein